MIQTACPLDCWDACAITCDPAFPTKLVATPSHPTSNGSLCALMSKHIHEAKRIEKPRVDGIEVSMGEALDAVAKALKAKEVLGWSGSGNLGVMQSVTDLLIAKLGGTLTKGSLCDGAGQAGIEQGRGYNRVLSPEQIAKSEVVVVWGRNLNVSNSHMLPFVKDKTIIVIDPVSTKLAKDAKMHLQIKPRSDLQLAMLLSRFVVIEGGEDREWIEEHSEGFEDFYELTQELRIKPTLSQIGIDLVQIGEFLNLVMGKRVVFLVGTAVQKYSHGSSVLRAIDALAAILGLFGKEGCGVSYLGNSKQGFDNPFAVDTKRVSIVNTPFEKFESVLVRGGNPAASMPDSNRVIESLKSVENLIYFGLYENETSALADIVIPAKNFLEKDDIRLSYSHQYVTKMNKLYDSDIGISEYQFTKELFDRLGLDGLRSEGYYIDYWLDQAKVENGNMISPDFKSIPYQDGFGKDEDEEFEFMDDYDDDYEQSDGKYWLISPKSPKSLNTQFVREDKVLIPSNSSFRDAKRVKVISKYGEAIFGVKLSGDLREDTVMIYAGSPNLNRLTPPIVSEDGENACYQELKVEIERV